MPKRKPSSNFLKAGQAWRAHLGEYRKKHPNMSLKQQMKGAKKTYKKSKSQPIHVRNTKYSVQIRPRTKKAGRKKTKKLKETVTRHFNKPVKSKSMFGLSISKVKKKNQKMIEKRVKEQQIKDDEKAYINEKMSRQKSNWKDDLTEV